MLPVLLNLGFIKIYTFGVFLVLAFFWSTFLLWKNVRLTSYKEEQVFDGLFISLFGGLFVGRLIYVALHFKDFGFDILKFLLINGYPGLSLYGVLIGGFLTFFIFSQMKKIEFMEVVDYMISPLCVALGIGKLGSFLSGVEVGSPTKLFLSMKYANFDGARHLTPLYEALLFFIVAFLAYRMLFAIRRDQLSRGFTFFFFGWAFSLVYFILDPLKIQQTKILGHSANWLVSVIFVLTLTVYLLYHLRTRIFGRISKITSSIQTHGRSKSSIYKDTTTEDGSGAEKASPTDSET